jgi:hypothetical protein
MDTHPHKKQAMQPTKNYKKSVACARFRSVSCDRNKKMKLSLVYGASSDLVEMIACQGGKIEVAPEISRGIQLGSRADTMCSSRYDFTPHCKTEISHPEVCARPQNRTAKTSSHGNFLGKN